MYIGILYLLEIRENKVIVDYQYIIYIMINFYYFSENNII